MSNVLVKDPGLVEYRMKSKACETDSSGRMSGANMILVTVNVMLGENDPEPDQHLDPVSLSITVLRGADWFHIQGEHIITRVVALRDFPATIKGIPLRQSSSEGSLGPTDYAKKGFAVDALVASIAMGWELSKAHSS